MVKSFVNTFDQNSPVLSIHKWIKETYQLPIESVIKFERKSLNITRFYFSLIFKPLEEIEFTGEFDSPASAESDLYKNLFDYILEQKIKEDYQLPRGFFGNSDNVIESRTTKKIRDLSIQNREDINKEEIVPNNSDNRFNYEILKENGIHVIYTEERVLNTIKNNISGRVQLNPAGFYSKNEFYYVNGYSCNFQPKNFKDYNVVMFMSSSSPSSTPSAMLLKTAYSLNGFKVLKPF